MRTTRWTTMALTAAMAVGSVGCFDRDDDDLERRAVPGAPVDRGDRDEDRTAYDPPGAAERVDESAERAAERLDESAEPEVDEGLDPQIDEHFDGRVGRAGDETR